MPDEDNPLQKIVADSKKINQQRLADTLDGLLNIDQESGKPIYLDGFDNLSSREKFIVYLLYRRAAESLGYLSEDEIGVSSREISEVIGVAAPTVRSYVGDQNIVRRDETHGGYYIPNPYLEKAMKKIPDEL